MVASYILDNIEVRRRDEGGRDRVYRAVGIAHSISWLLPLYSTVHTIVLIPTTSSLQFFDLWVKLKHMLNRQIDRPRICYQRRVLGIEKGGQE